MEHLAPSMWSHRQAEQAKVWMARFERMAATPGAALAHFDFNLTNDVRALLPSISAPTLVLHRRGDRFVPLCNGEHLASVIPDARLVIVEGEDHVPWVGDAARIVDEVQLFLTGRRGQRTNTPGPATEALSTLTAAEYRVAEAVAEGLNNPQIAEALHLSRHTVESHLKRIYTKLGVNRVELATLVTRGPGN